MIGGIIVILNNRYNSKFTIYNTPPWIYNLFIYNVKILLDVFNTISLRPY